MAERGEGLPQWSLSPATVNISYGQQPGNQAAGVGTGAGWFDPLTPLAPLAPNSVAGRQFDFPAGYNIQTQPRAYEGITFVNLRMLADAYDLLRLVIETRKDQVERMEWTIKAKSGAKVDQGEIGRITDFFNSPDGPDGEHDFASWMRALLEDLFVIDAPAIWCERTRGGQLIGLHPLDGATIKPVIDAWGRRPRPVQSFGRVIYPVAYQQILKGLPAVDYTARDLIYAPRNRRANRVYGLGPVEQIIMTVSIALRRQQHQLNYYTEGNIPESLIGVPDTWTPDQIKTFQDYWDMYFTGDSARRRRAKFVPGGVAKTFIQTREPELKNVFDEWLARVVCYAFSVSSQPLINQVNRATAETQKESAEEEGLWPVLNWIKRLCDRVIRDELNQPNVEFAWGGEDKTDPTVQRENLVSYVNAGMMTRRRAAQIMGEELPQDPAVDTLMVMTSSGPVPLDQYQQAREQAQALAETQAKAAQAHVQAQQAAPQGQEGSAGGDEPAKSETATGAPLRTTEDPAKPEPKLEAKKLAKADTRTLYVNRALENADDLIAWAKGQGFETTLQAQDMHATIVYSKTPLEWPEPSEASKVTAGNAQGRSIERFGEDAVVLTFSSAQLAADHARLRAAGASSDYPEFRPHITLTYDAGDIDLNQVEPYAGPLHFGPEVYQEIKKGWADGIGEKMAFAPAGTFTKAAPSPKARRAHRAIKAVMLDVFKTASAKVAKTVRDELSEKIGKLAKAEDGDDDGQGLPKSQASDLAKSISAKVDLSAFDDAAGAVGDALADFAADAAEQAILRIGPDVADGLVDQVNAGAVAWARDRAAELVGKRILPNGDIIDNPRAEMAITGSTRDMIRNAVAEGLEQNTGIDAIVEKIESLAFSPERADLIAEVEVGNANSNAALIGFKGAREGGVKVKKAWSTAQDEKVEEECRKNEEAGAIDLDDVFPSGHAAPLCHPRCRCALIPVVEDD